MILLGRELLAPLGIALDHFGRGILVHYFLLKAWRCLNKNWAGKRQVGGAHDNASAA
jgi:hypothetical protein